MIVVRLRAGAVRWQQVSDDARAVEGDWVQLGPDPDDDRWLIVQRVAEGAPVGPRSRVAADDVIARASEADEWDGGATENEPADDASLDAVVPAPEPSAIAALLRFLRLSSAADDALLVAATPVELADSSAEVTADVADAADTQDAAPVASTAVAATPPAMGPLAGAETLATASRTPATANVTHEVSIAAPSTLEPARPTASPGSRPTISFEAATATPPASIAPAIAAFASDSVAVKPPAIAAFAADIVAVTPRVTTSAAQVTPPVPQVTLPVALVTPPVAQVTLPVAQVTPSVALVMPVAQPLAVADHVPARSVATVPPRPTTSELPPDVAPSVAATTKRPRSSDPTVEDAPTSPPAAAHAARVATRARIAVARRASEEPARPAPVAPSRHNPPTARDARSHETLPAAPDHKREATPSTPGPASSITPDRSAPRAAPDRSKVVLAKRASSAPWVPVSVPPEAPAARLLPGTAPVVDRTPAAPLPKMARAEAAAVVPTAPVASSAHVTETATVMRTAPVADTAPAIKTASLATTTSPVPARAAPVAGSTASAPKPATTASVAAHTPAAAATVASVAPGASIAPVASLAPVARLVLDGIHTSSPAPAAPALAPVATVVPRAVESVDSPSTASRGARQQVNREIHLGDIIVELGEPLSPPRPIEHAGSLLAAIPRRSSRPRRRL